MIQALIGFLIKLGFGGVVDKAIGHLERRAELENDRERLKAMTTVELAKQAVVEAQIMADFNKAKLGHWPFWVLVFMISAPMVLWQWAVIIDSIPYLRDFFGDQQVANLPTAALQEAFSSMIQWTFYLGSTTGAVALLRR